MHRISNWGHGAANLFRALGQAVAGSLRNMWEWVSIGKKPAGDVYVRGMGSDPVVGGRVISEMLTNAIKDEYSGVTFDIEQRLEGLGCIKDKFLSGWEVKRRDNDAGKNFSEEIIQFIKEKGSALCDAKLIEQIKNGKVPGDADVRSALQEALIEVVLLLPQNQSLTRNQREAALGHMRRKIDTMNRNRNEHPSWNTADLIKLTDIQDHLDEQNPLCLLEGLLYPIMRDVRADSGEDRDTIMINQNSMVGLNLRSINALRSKEEDTFAVDAIIAETLKEPLVIESGLDPESTTMTPVQFSVLVDLLHGLNENVLSQAEISDTLLRELRDSCAEKLMTALQPMLQEHTKNGVLPHLKMQLLQSYAGWFNKLYEGDVSHRASETAIFNQLQSVLNG